MMVYSVLIVCFLVALRLVSQRHRRKVADLESLAEMWRAQADDNQDQISGWIGKVNVERQDRLNAESRVTELQCELGKLRKKLRELGEAGVKDYFADE